MNDLQRAINSGIPELVSYERKMARINLLVKGMVEGGINSFIVSGAPGIGKTHTVLKELEKYEETHGTVIDLIRGHISPLEVYELLHTNSGPQHVTVFDDSDTVFENTGSLNILKAASETAPTRRISWATRAASVPEFYFEGKIIVLTNVEVTNNVHLNAMNDRFLIYNPKVTMQEKLNKIKDIAQNSEEISEEIGLGVMNWLFSNSEKLEKLTLRTFIKTAELAKSLPDDWQDMASAMILSGDD